MSIQQINDDTLIALFRLHLKISVNSFNDTQLENNEHISVTLLKFQLDISGNEINDEQL